MSSTAMTRKRASALTQLVLCSVLWGCGELTSGGVGEVEVWATADDQGGAASSSPPATTADQASRESVAAGGVLTAQLRTYLRSDLTGEWIEITDGVRDITLDLDGSAERRVGVRFLDGGRYSGLRVVFQRMEANVTSGLVVGGISITGVVRVDLGTQGTLTVERSLLLDLEAGGNQDVVLDLAASTWLPTLSLVTRTVTGAAFSSAIDVRVR